MENIINTTFSIIFHVTIMPKNDTNKHIEANVNIRKHRFIYMHSKYILYLYAPYLFRHSYAVYSIYTRQQLTLTSYSVIQHIQTEPMLTKSILLLTFELHKLAGGGEGV